MIVSSLRLACLACLLFVYQSISAPIPIINSGFESPALSDSGFTFSVTGWTQLPGFPSFSYVVNPAAADFPLLAPLEAPEGNQIAQIGVLADWSGPFLYQNVGVPVLPDTSYLLSFEVGDTMTGGLNFSGDASLPNYVVELLSGTTVIASSLNPVIPLNGGFASASLAYVSPRVAPFLYGSLGVRFSVTGTTSGTSIQALSLDNIRLEATAVPEAGSMALAGIAGGIFVASRWRRSK